MFNEYSRYLNILCDYFNSQKYVGTVLKPSLTGTGFARVTDSLKGVKSYKKNTKNKAYYDNNNRRVLVLRNGGVRSEKDEKRDGRFQSVVYTDGYNSYDLGRSSIRNSTRRQKIKKPPISALIKYGLNEDIINDFEVNVDKCVIVDGCYKTNLQVLKRQLIPECVDGTHHLYPTIDNLKMFDSTVKAVFRKLKTIGMIESQWFEDIADTEVSPDKKPGFRYEEEFNQHTKKEAIHTALKLAKRRWNYATNVKLSEFSREDILPGAYTIGARNKRDYTYDDGEPAASRVVHMPEFHCELTSAPWCDAFMSRIKELAQGPIYLGNSILDWFRLNKDIKDSHYVLEGDWKRFDSTLYIKIITVALCIFRCFFEHGSSYVDKHFLLMYDSLAIKDYYLVGGRVVRSFHGLPSGVKSTSLLGSIINLVALIFCVGADRSSFFNFIVGGDDFLVSARRDSISVETLIDEMQTRSSVIGMTFKFLKVKKYESSNIEDCPVFYKYTIYKGRPVVPTSSVFERVFMPWNKSYNTETTFLKFLYDVMPSLGTPMSHHLLYYDLLQYSIYKVSSVKVSYQYLFEVHNFAFEQMMSRKLAYKTFEYKSDSAPLRKDVSSLLLEFKDEKRYNNSRFCEEVVSKFSYL
jgi:hypothetical protein